MYCFRSQQSSQWPRPPQPSSSQWSQPSPSQQQQWSQPSYSSSQQQWSQPLTSQDQQQQRDVERPKRASSTPVTSPPSMVIVFTRTSTQVVHSIYLTTHICWILLSIIMWHNCNHWLHFI